MFLELCLPRQGFGKFNIGTILARLYIFTILVKERSNFGDLCLETTNFGDFGLEKGKIWQFLYTKLKLKVLLMQN